MHYYFLALPTCTSLSRVWLPPHTFRCYARSRVALSSFSARLRVWVSCGMTDVVPEHATDPEQIEQDGFTQHNQYITTATPATTTTSTGAVITAVITL